MAAAAHKEADHRLPGKWKRADQMELRQLLQCIEIYQVGSYADRLIEWKWCVRRARGCWSRR